MELSTEAISISKILDGIFIGDMRAGINLDLLMQFKISHIINATGMKLPYTFESIGVKYLNVEWPDNPKEEETVITTEIVSKIISFIDESLMNGEGLFGFSFNGKNRICVVIILFLMTKFMWPLKKCFEYVKKKKSDIDINTSYKNQLTDYEKKLFENSNNHIVKQKLFWNLEDILKDKNELLMRNTYMNEVKNYIINSENKNDLERNKVKITRHVEWGDNKKYAKQMTQPGLIHYNIDKDLFFKKNVEDITEHIHKKPLRGCIKNSNNNNFNSNVTSTIRRKKKKTKIYLAADTNSRNNKNDIKNFQDVDHKDEKLSQKNNNNENIVKKNSKEENKNIKENYLLKNKENNENHIVNNLFIASSKSGENDSDDEIKLNNIISTEIDSKENKNINQNKIENKNLKLLIKKSKEQEQNIQPQKVTNTDIKPILSNLLKIDPNLQTLKKYLKANKKKPFINFSNTIPDFKINKSNINTNENINSINESNNIRTINTLNNNNEINTINLIPVNSNIDNKESENKNSDNKKKNGIYLLNLNLNIDNRTTFNIKNNFFNNGNNINAFNKKLNNFFTDSNGNTYFNSFNQFKNKRSNTSEKKDYFNDIKFLSPNINYYLGNPNKFILHTDNKNKNEFIPNISINKNSHSINNPKNINKNEKPKLFIRPTINIDKNNINNMINNNKNILINNISNSNTFNRKESKFNLIILYFLLSSIFLKN